MDNALILIIEDEPEIAEILDAYLGRDGFRTVVGAFPCSSRLRTILRPEYELGFDAVAG